jgi:hypothetical protein
MMFVVLAGCGDITPKPDATAPPPARAVMPTSGGGAASSSSYRVRLSIGAPQPMGSASSDAFAVRLGPNQ